MATYSMKAEERPWVDLVLYDFQIWGMIWIVSDGLAVIASRRSSRCSLGGIGGTYLYRPEHSSYSSQCLLGREIVRKHSYSLFV